MQNKNIIYSDEAKTILYKVIDTKSIVIPAKVQIIYGENDQSYAFKESKDVIDSITFEENSNLKKISDYAFYFCTKIKKLDFSPCTQLTTIGKYSISYSPTLESVKLPISVESLGERAFESNGALQSIFIPASVKEIGARLFCDCGSLNSAVFDPESKLKVLTWGAFFGCVNLENFTIPKSFELFENCFRRCHKFNAFYVDPLNPLFYAIDGVVYTKDNTTVVDFPVARTGTYTIKGGVTKIGMCAFADSKLTTVVLPQSLTYIGAYAFHSAKITSVDIPQTVKDIHRQSFAGTLILEVRLPSNINLIGEQAFSGCKNLQKIYMPLTFNSIGGGIFAGCTSLTTENIIFDPTSDFQINEDEFVYNKAGTDIILYLGTATTLTIKSTVVKILSKVFFQYKALETINFEGSSKLTFIGTSAFEGSGLRQITFPDSLEEIQQYAFRYCSNLVTVKFSKNLNKIIEEAFDSCTSLKTVEFVESTAESLVLQNKCFKGCTELNTVTFNKGVTKIESYAFQNCVKLTSVSLPESLKEIQASAFYGTSLESFAIDLAAPIERLPSQLFSGCSTLSEVQLSDNIRFFDAECFSNTKVKTITLPNDVEVIDMFCFKDCKELTSFHIPFGSHLAKIKYGTFSGCTSFANITCQCANFSLFNGALYDANKTKLVVVPPQLPIKYFAFPDTLTVVSEGALFGCQNIVNILISSNTVTQIENNAFQDCIRLKNINIPISVQSVGKDAFKGCPMLQCGLEIENTSDEYKKMLIEVAKMPKRCFDSCFALCSKSYIFPNFRTLSVLFFYIIC